ncbi:MAG: heavy metal translocating P-type ATPase [Alphaproteobacteria bacterium]
MEQYEVSDPLQLPNGIDAENTGYESLAKESEQGGLMLELLVRGVHCAACIQKIETCLHKEADVSYVRLNFSTGHLKIEWGGEDSRANVFVQNIEALGYNVLPYSMDQEKSESEEEDRFLLMCLGVAGFAMGNVMLLSVGLWTTSAETMGMATRDFMHWISAIIALPAILFAGRPFFRSAIRALRVRQTNMDVPISIALILTSVMSLYETMHHGEHVYFDSSVMLMFFLLVGRYLDFHARRSARSVATDLLSSLSGFAKVMEGNNVKRIAVRDIEEGAFIYVSTGEKIPLDGVIHKGETDIDTSLVTGETLPRRMTVGQDVFAGTVNISSPITVKVLKTAKNTLLADIVALMEKAQQNHAHYVRMADKAARLYTPVVHLMAVLAFLGWWLIGGITFQASLLIAVTVLIITCPCALGLAVPVVQVLASGVLMKRGIIVKSGDALERLASVDVVLLDKTGTLSVGKPTLQEPYDEQSLQMAASLAVHSAHPLSQAICSAYDGEILNVSHVEEIMGQGMQGEADQGYVRIGRRAWCGDMAAESFDLQELWLSVEGQEPVVFLFSDVLRTDAVEVVEQFRKSGCTPVILSGDRQAVVEKVAKQCGISEYRAEQTPPQKFEYLEGLKKEGKNVLMVGDGLNDTPTLAGADVSMAPGSAIDMAQNTADIVFMGDQLSPIYHAYKTAIYVQKFVKQNFMLAVLYNIIAIPLALAGMVTPWVAALAMSGSSLLVIGNSFRLKFKI